MSAARLITLPAVGPGFVACSECGGNGVDGVLCFECEGAGTERDATPVAIGGVAAYQAYYIALLRRNNVSAGRIVPFNAPYLNGRRQPFKIAALYFVGEGFEGMLVGLKRPETAEVARG